MTTTTSTRTTRPVPDQPTDTHRGLPVYGSGEAPDDLMTAGQLEAAGRRRTPGQKPRAYLWCLIRHQGWTRVDLYHIEDTRAVRLSPRQEAQKLARRTCILCASVAERPLLDRSRRQHLWLPVSGRICTHCDDAHAKRWRRTCARCGAEFRNAKSVHHRECTACHEIRQHGEELARRLARRHCPDCTVQTVTREELAAADAADQFGRAIGYPRTCGECIAERQRQAEEARRAEERERWDELGPVRRWARRIVADPHLFAILDTETTGLDPDAAIVEIGITDGAGTTLLDTLVHPGKPIPEETTAIHGISDDDVREAPSFGEVLPRITAALADRQVIIYNRAYDTGVLAYELSRHHHEQAPTLPGAKPDDDGTHHPFTLEWMDAQQWDRCAMHAYAVHVGEWSHYWQGWSWQRLNGGHRALGDCQAVAARIREMAARPDPF
ncbi:3'-5' exonuclease [Streptomyces sp. NPDC047973]|uniref:3'-5' exonuclease n=1 Tax=Streptomyces sp. NPDC047973 TaxID=3155383 RepID=UPI0034358A13